MDEPSTLTPVAIAIASYLPSVNLHTLTLCMGMIIVRIATQYLLQTVTSNSDPIEQLTIHEKERRAPLLHYTQENSCVCAGTTANYNYSGPEMRSRSGSGDGVSAML